MEHVGAKLGKGEWRHEERANGQENSSNIGWKYWDGWITDILWISEQEVEGQVVSHMNLISKVEQMRVR